MMIELVIFIIGIFFFAAMSDRKGRQRSGGPTIHFCEDGIEGHERRVCEFYGDDYDEMVAERERLFAYREQMQNHPDVEEKVIGGITVKCYKISKEDLDKILNGDKE